MRPRIRVSSLLVAILVAASLVAVAPLGGNVGASSSSESGPFKINILHINDHHSHLNPDGGFSADLGTSAGEVSFDAGGFPQLVRKFEQIESRRQNVVKIHAGDAITGTLFYSLFKGEADAALMNQICFDMFALGNHEFDDGDAQLADGFLADLAADPDCDTPVIAANVVPEVGTPLRPTAETSLIQPYVIKEFGPGELVGFIGIDIAQKTKVSSSPLESTQFLDEVETAQFYVDELTAQGIENIVLVTHYQYENDLALAAQVTGIDAIVGGDSHTLLGDFEAIGLDSSGPYPTMTTNADGDPVCIVQAWQYSHVVGNLTLRFEDGKTRGCWGTPFFMVSEPEEGFTKEVEIDGEDEDVPLTPQERREFVRAIWKLPNVSIGKPDPASQAILDEFNEQVLVLEQQVIGTATEDLCLERIPGQGRSAICAVDEVSDSGAISDVNGGFIQQIVTDAFAARAFRADFALQNAGGVRIDIPAGDITIADAFTLLPFANTLVELELSGQEVADVLEDAVDNFLEDGGSTGSYPYGSKLRWDVDLSQPSGSRFSNIEVFDGPAWVPLDVAATYVVVTNSFIASGRDGYDAFGVAFDEGRVVDTFIDYAQGFIDWVEQDAGGVVSVPDPSMFSTQNFTPAPG
ncbi:MAG: bifunctional metallophosphatase/5'-nucleotidase [Acidimicrobiales bacterium]